MWMLKRKEQAVTQTRAEPAPLLQPGPSAAVAQTAAVGASSANPVIPPPANTVQPAANAGIASAPPPAALVRQPQVSPGSGPSGVATAPVRLGVSSVANAAPSARPTGIAVAPPAGNPGLGQVANGAQAAPVAARSAPLNAVGNSTPSTPSSPVLQAAPQAHASVTPMSLSAEDGNDDKGQQSQEEKAADPHQDDKADVKKGGATPPGGTTPPSGPLIGISDATVETFAAAALGQVVSMLGEDTRTYLQGMEQIYTAAAGKALAMIAKGEPDQAIGIALLAQIKASQQDTTTFATDIASLAKQFVSIKGG